MENDPSHPTETPAPEVLAALLDFCDAEREARAAQATEPAPAP